MFKSISYSNVASDDNEYVYLIDDTNFKTQIILNLSSDATSSNNRASRALAIIQEYSRRNLPIAKNLARFYYSLKEEIPSISYIYSHAVWLDRYYPKLNYKSKYYRCVLIQYTDLILKRDNLV